MKKLTPAQRHQLRARAEMEAAATPAADSMAGATTYELQLMQIKQDLHRLKQMQSIDARNLLKPALLPAYDPYINGVLAAGKGAADEVLTTVMLWHFDIASFERGLEIAAYVLTHNLSMPDRFSRTTATLVAEEVANAALSNYKQDKPFEFGVLKSAFQLTEDKDMPDEVRAKLNFALALAVNPTEASSLEDLEHAATLMREAIRLHSRVGAIKNLERVERWIKKYADNAKADTAETDTAATAAAEETGKTSPAIESAEAESAESEVDEKPAEKPDTESPAADS